MGDEVERQRSQLQQLGTKLEQTEHSLAHLEQDRRAMESEIDSLSAQVRQIEDDNERRLSILNSTEDSFSKLAHVMEELRAHMTHTQDEFATN